MISRDRILTQLELKDEDVGKLALVESTRAPGALALNPRYEYKKLGIVLDLDIDSPREYAVFEIDESVGPEKESECPAPPPKTKSKGDANHSSERHPSEAPSPSDSSDDSRGTLPVSAPPSTTPRPEPRVAEASSSTKEG